MKKIAFMFPGQGSQQVGMSKDLYDNYESTKTLFNKANETLGFNLKSLMFDGPEEALRKTEHAQPALLLSSIATHELLIEAGIKPEMTIGHSLGEYSALVASGVLSLMDALKLVHERGKLMEQAYPAGQGSMAAVLGLDQVSIQNVLNTLDTDEVINVANLNCPGQIVISGTKEGVQNAIEPLKEKGAKRVKELVVSGPFHSELMKPASEKFSKELANVTFNDPNMPVYANVSASVIKPEQNVQDLLVKQLYSPVRFEESVVKMIADGAEVFVEVGNGKVLSGLLRKIDRSIPTFAIQDKASLEAFIQWYKESN